MQKILVPVGVAALFGCGVFFYSYMMSDEMVLRRLGYDRSLIQELVDKQPDLVQDLIDDHRNYQDLESYLEVPALIMIVMTLMFNFQSTIKNSKPVTSFI